MYAALARIAIGFSSMPRKWLLRPPRTWCPRKVALYRVKSRRHRGVRDLRLVVGGGTVSVDDGSMRTADAVVATTIVGPVTEGRTSLSLAARVD